MSPEERAKPLKTRFRDAALLLLAHGSAGGTGRPSPIGGHAARLRRSGLFAEVHECYWKQPPRVEEVLPTVGAQRLFIVPLFVSEGHFSEEVVPAALNLKEKGAPAFERVRFWRGRLLHYCLPVGGHPAITEIILKLAREVVRRNPMASPPHEGDILLLIAGHGTSRHSRSRRAIERQADLIRGRRLYSDVSAVFLEEAPRIADWHGLGRQKHVVVVPFFIGEGMHTLEDIPVLLGQPAARVRERLGAGAYPWPNPTLKGGRYVWYSDLVGNDAALEAAILGRVTEIAVARHGSS